MELGIRITYIFKINGRMKFDNTWVCPGGHLPTRQPHHHSLTHCPPLTPTHGPHKTNTTWPTFIHSLSYAARSCATSLSFWIAEGVHDTNTRMVRVSFMWLLQVLWVIFVKPNSHFDRAHRSRLKAHKVDHIYLNPSNTNLSQRRYRLGQPCLTIP